MGLIERTILLLTVSALLSCSSADNPTPSCTNLVRRWSFSEEQRFKGQVKSVLVSELVLESESHFLLMDIEPRVRTMLEFDFSGKLSKETDFTTDGKPMSPTVYIYDENGFLVQEHQLSGIDGKPTLPTTYSYNEDGTNHEIRQTSDKGVVYSIWTFSNDPESNYSEFVATKTDGKFEMKIGVARDERCRISALYHFPYFGLWLGKADINYDENDNPVFVKSYAPLGISREQRKYEYEFDEIGNWIKKSDYTLRKTDDGSTAWNLMNERYQTIEYYEQ